MVSMPVADAAVADLITSEVLKPPVVNRALDRALELLTPDRDAADAEHDRIRARLTQVEREIANLTETAAKGGAVPILLEALGRREAERQQLVRQLSATQQQGTDYEIDDANARIVLRGFLRDWKGLLAGNRTEARGLLDLVLAGQRIAFEPRPEGGYELMLPVAFDRVISAALPALRGAQDACESRWGRHLLWCKRSEQFHKRAPAAEPIAFAVFECVMVNRPSISFRRICCPCAGCRRSRARQSSTRAATSRVAVFGSISGIGASWSKAVRRSARLAS
jgi:hypothetical protein